MIIHVYCVDGPMRGKFLSIRSDSLRFSAACAPRYKFGIYDDFTTEIGLQPIDYHLHRFAQTNGVLHREFQIASLRPRVDDIPADDLWPIDIMIRRVPWSAGPEPSFLKNFDTWFVWAAYKSSAGSKAFRDWVERGGMSWRAWDRVGRFMFHHSK